MLFLLLLPGAFNVPGQSGGNKFEINLKEISEYKSWSKATPKPHLILFTIDGVEDWDATFLIGDEKKKSKFRKPIKAAKLEIYGEVYINEIAAKGAEARKFLFTEVENKNDLEKSQITDSNKMAEGAFRFPTGSIIVREKRVTNEKPDVKSLAVMIKRERSFSPLSDGWQFLYLDPKTLAITKNDQVICLSCHKLKKETDFVFNSYRP